MTLAGNVGLGGLSGASTGYRNGNGLAADFVAANFNGAPPIDVFPKSGSALIGAGNTSYAVDADFNGTPRAGTVDAGAYKFAAGGNPGWTLAAGFKPMTGTTIPRPPTNLSAQ